MEIGSIAFGICTIPYAMFVEMFLWLCMGVSITCACGIVIEHYLMVWSNASIGSTGGPLNSSVTELASAEPFSPLCRRMTNDASFSNIVMKIA